MATREISVRLVIHGRVQGVGYRWWAVGEARRLGVRGWVRNRRDGSVELLAIGTVTAIDALAARCLDGPPVALVGRIDHYEAEDDGSIGFDQGPTQ